MLERMQPKWIRKEHMRSYWPFVRSCFWWLVQTAFYAWIAPWVLLAAFLTLFRPSAQTIRELVIDLATAERSDWAHLPEMWMAASLVIGGFVVVSRVPGSPIWLLVEEKLLDPLVKRIEETWERCSAPVRRSLKYSLGALVVGTVSLFAVAVHKEHAQSSQGISLPSAPVPPPTAAAASAALALADGSLVSGTAQVSRQSDSSYVVRFGKPAKGSHE